MRAPLLLGALLLLLAGCGVVDPQASRNVTAGARPAGRILFAQAGDIYLWDGDVKQVTRVGNASMPSWAPDGNRFVFVESGNGYSDLYVGEMGGSNYWKVTNNKPTAQEGSETFVNNAVWALDPVWSPTSDTIVYVSDQGTPMTYLWSLPGLGKQPQQIRATAQNEQDVEDPSFSPDGSKVVYTQRTVDPQSGVRSTALFIVDPGQGTATKLVQGEDGSYDAAWSPDGKWIAYVQRNGKSNDLWVIPATGGSATKLTDGRAIASPCWSPDGTAVAFFEPDGTSFHVSYVTVSAGVNGTVSASKPTQLFTAGQIDAPSGLSWTK